MTASFSEDPHMDYIFPFLNVAQCLPEQVHIFFELLLGCSLEVCTLEDCFCTAPFRVPPNGVHGFYPM